MEQNHHNSGHSSNQHQNSNHTPLTTYFFKVTYIFKVCTHVHAQRFTPQITSRGDSTNSTLSNLFYAVHLLFFKTEISRDDALSSLLSFFCTSSTLPVHISYQLYLAIYNTPLSATSKLITVISAALPPLRFTPCA
jgi:hypothetical protein